MIFDEYIYNIDNLRDIVERDFACFNIDQKIMFDILYQIIVSDEEDMFFLDEFDDIEKIFLINLMLMKIRFDEEITLIIIFFDIIVILLDEDMMTYSRFKILIDIKFDSIYNILIQNHLIELIHEIKLIFWDEILM